MAMTPRLSSQFRLAISRRSERSPSSPQRFPESRLPTIPLKSRRRYARNQRGQAMLEYSILKWLLIVGLVLGCTVRLIPGPGRRQSVVEAFFGAYQVYYRSHYSVLNSPFP